MLRILWFALPLLLISGCSAPPDPPLPPPDATAAPARRPVDLLFVLDNSPGVLPRQRALLQAVPPLLAQLEAQAVDYHLAVISTDVGTTPGFPWSGGDPRCNSERGDDGELQRLPCSARRNLSAAAREECLRLCPDPSFVPASGQGYIAWGSERGNNVKRAPTDGGMPADQGPLRAFQCLALLGDGGCGVEGPLEALRRALDGHNPRDGGFLREGSVLAVLFLTDEDDCSLSEDGRRASDPESWTCPDPDAEAPPGCFNSDFRCLTQALRCDEPLNTAGAKHHCREHPGGFLNPVDPYADFLRALRPRPGSLLLAGLYPLPSLEDAASGGALLVEQSRSRPGTPGLSRAAAVAGPQLRLSRLVRQFPGHLEADVQRADRYGELLASLAQALLAQLH